MEVHRLKQYTGHRAAIYALEASPDPHRFLSGGGDGWIVEWDVRTPEEGKLIASIENRVFSLLQIPAQNLMLAGNMDGGIHWITLDAPEQTRLLAHHKRGVFGLLQHGDYLFSIGGDGMLTRWSIARQAPLESIQLSTHALRSITYSAQRNELAIGSSDCSIYLVHAETLECTQRIVGAHSNSVFTLAYHPSNNTLLSAGRDAMLRSWNLNQIEKPVQEIAAHLFTINHIAFSPDQKLLATASRDKTLKIWDADTLQLLKVLESPRDQGHINSVNRLLWTSKGLFTAGDDRQIIQWEIAL